MRAAAYRGLWALARHTGRLSNAFLYLAAGVLREDELQADSELRWRAFGTTSYDADAGLDGDEREFYTRFVSPPNRILLVGSGGGRDLIALHALGYSVSGLEQVGTLVDLSRQRIADRRLPIAVVRATIQAARLYGSFDAVIFSSGCYSYIRGSAARISALTKLAAHMSPTGIVVLSYHPCSGHSTLAMTLTGLTARISTAGWLPERGDVFSRDYAVPDVLRYHHEFDPADLAGECRRAAFQIVADEARGALRFAAAVRIDEARSVKASARIASQTAGRASSERW